MNTAAEILRKHEDANEMHFHESSLEPRKSTVIITLDIPIVIIEEYPEEDTNYKGRLDWDFQNKNKFMIDLNDKIIKEIIEHKL